MDFKYKLTLTSHCGIKTLFEANDEKEMANFIFNNGYYKKSVGVDDYIDLITEHGELNYYTLDKWVEKYIPKKTRIIIKKLNFQRSFVGRSLVNLGLMEPWHMYYLKIIRTRKSNV